MKIIKAYRTAPKPTSAISLLPQHRYRVVSTIRSMRTRVCRTLPVIMTIILRSRHLLTSQRTMGAMISFRASQKCSRLLHLLSAILWTLPNHQVYACTYRLKSQPLLEHSHLTPVYQLQLLRCCRTTSTSPIRRRPCIKAPSTGIVVHLYPSTKLLIRITMYTTTTNSYRSFTTITSSQLTIIVQGATRTSQCILRQSV